jgi:DNA-binding response OmpR family regulator
MRLLVIEHDPDLAAALADLLADEGHEVLLARDGPEALRALDAASPELLLFDLQLQDATGWALLDALTAGGGPRLPAVVISGEAHLAPAGIRALQKPLHAPALLDALEAAARAA